MGQYEIPKRFRAVLADKAGYILRDIMDYQIHYIIAFNGRVNETIMQQAYEMSLDAEPVLGCRFVYDKKEPYWERIDRKTDSNNFRLVNTSDTQTAMNDFIAEPFDTEVGPQVKICIFRSEHDTLCIKVNHMPADGAAVKEYGYLLAAIYQELQKDSQYNIAPNINGSRSYRQIGDGLSFTDKLKLIRRFFLDLKTKKAHWQCMDSLNEGSDYVVTIRGITPERFRAIKQYGKERRATINDMLVAAYFRALHKTVGPCDGVSLGIMTTADHRRRYLPSGKTGALCILSGFFFSNIGYEPGADFDDTLQRVVRDINSRKDDFIGLGEIPLSSLLFTKLPFAYASKGFRKMLNSVMGHGYLNAAFTNLGIIDKEMLDFADADVEDAYIIVPASIKPKNSMIIGITTYNENLKIHSTFKGRAQDKKNLESLLDNMVQQLPV